MPPAELRALFQFSPFSRVSCCHYADDFATLPRLISCHCRYFSLSFSLITAAVFAMRLITPFQRHYYYRHIFITPPLAMPASAAAPDDFLFGLAASQLPSLLIFADAFSKTRCAFAHTLSRLPLPCFSTLIYAFAAADCHFCRHLPAFQLRTFRCHMLRCRLPPFRFSPLFFAVFIISAAAVFDFRSRHICDADARLSPAISIFSRISLFLQPAFDIELIAGHFRHYARFSFFTFATSAS
jgi:hypothetical protein